MSKELEHPTLKRFTYWDNSKQANGEMLLSTVASTIAFADAELLNRKGFDVVRCPWIGCEIGAFLSVPYNPPKNRIIKDYQTLLREVKPSREVEVLTAYVKSGCERPCDSVRVSTGLKPKKKQDTSGAKRRLHVLHAKQFGECYYCWNPTKIEDWTIDHVLARSMGGGNNAANLVGACRECNTYKGSLSVEIFEASEYLRRKRESAELPDSPTPDPSP